MRIRELREQRGIQQKELASYLGISPNTLSQYENYKREPGLDAITKIADFFDVSIDYVYGNTDITTCKDCGLTYCPVDDFDIKLHNELHANWKNAIKKFGFCYNRAESERIKAENRNIVCDTSLMLNERYSAQIEVFKCLFSRSLELNNYDIDHVEFDKYVSMLLHQKHFKDTIDSALYSELVQNFGTSEGLMNGTTIYQMYIPKNEYPNTMAAHFEGDKFTEDELEEIKQFAEFIKKRRK
ncbi:helix-turn-helix domain-containing protein [Anaerocolumna sp.]|uniref:helix-turn-helix domain-containing protein n=1 Tax=Anaerocolumna sp. TaxID=2041569 RepID=UPI0028B01C7B|nr:helix-turn-helix domain-containing protein [Anaerocolumna sp.]